MIVKITLTLFLIMDPFGNLPVLISLLKNYDKKIKIKILIRELLISLFLIFIFILFGKQILELFGLSEASVSIAGGIILFLIALKMIFPSNETENTDKTDLLIVPIAIPMIAGPSLLAVLLLLSNSYNFHILFTASIISWALTSFIIIFFTYLAEFIPYKFFNAAEKLMGMLLIALSVQMLLDGIANYLHLK
ncbi:MULTISPECIES: MarC family protein [unclassified Lebetimonas]|uniref:MarC family protein n=1 Tax=unclassified Lebetimonas TaxID=2648158 RepID=UPI0004655435|nr:MULTISPECIES: MarC family protein [unclassified Lebetimonas]